MKKRSSFLCLLFISILSFQLASAREASISKQDAQELLGNKSIAFIENKGQMADQNGRSLSDVFFRVSAPGTDVYITNKGLTYILLQQEQAASVTKLPDFKKPMEPQTINTKWERIDMELNGATINMQNVVREGMSEDQSAYYFANCPDGVFNVHSYGKITFKEIYPGIDWVLYNSGKEGFKYDFIIHANADPKQIAIIYNASQPLKILKDGSLEIDNKYSTVRENAPYSYQQNKKIKSEFKIGLIQKNETGGYDSHVSFDLASYDKNKDLVIDPQLIWSTLFGGAQTDYIHNIASDSLGNIFVVGITLSPAFPLANPGFGAYYNGAYQASFDAFVSKFRNNCSLVWSTFYGGSDADYFNSICVDPYGNIFIVGNSASFNFPVFNPGGGAYFQNPILAPVGSPVGDIVILKFSNSGQRLWATDFGGTSTDSGYDICSDSNGNIFIIGATAANTIPFLNPGGGAYFQTFLIGVSNDIVILKFNNACALLWSTLYGGNNVDVATNLTLDGSGNLYVTGYTESTTFPTQNPGGGTYYDGTYNSLGSAFSGDVFILKFNNVGVRMWATYYGGSSSDVGADIKIDHFGDIVVTGGTGSLNFPLQNPGAPAFFQSTVVGGDGFIMKFNNAGVRKWSTFYGGDGGESLGNIAIDNCNNLYVSGTVQNATNMTMIPDCNGGLFDNAMALGDHKAVLLKFTSNNALNWSTYTYGFMGGVFDPFNNLFMVGGTVAFGFPPFVNPGGGAYFDNSFGGSDDGTIGKFKLHGNYTNLISTTSPGCGCIGTASLNSTSACSAFKYEWYDVSNSLISNTQLATGLCPGAYTGIIYDTLNCHTDTLTTALTSNPINAVCSTVVVPCGNYNTGSVSVSSSGGSAPYSYNWLSTGGTNATEQNLAAGTYSVVVTDPSGCVDTASLILPSNPVPVSSLVGDDTICAGETLSLSAGGGGTYLWNTGDTDQSISIDPTVTTGYSVVVSNANCSDTSFFTVIVNDNPVIGLQSNYTIALNDSIQLVTSATGTFVWSPANDLSCSDCPAPYASPDVTTNYCLTVTNENSCASSACILVNVVMPNSVFIPNAFTPDGNVLNDTFKPVIIGAHDYKLLVFDRWGQELFESNDIDKGWNGFYKQRLCQQDVYVYKITYWDDENNSFHQHLGSFTLLR